MTDLESTAKVYHTIYDNFLQRYMEAIQQQSFPITEARVISPAAPSERKSVLTLTVLGIAAAIGLSGASAQHFCAMPSIGYSGRRVRLKAIYRPAVLLCCRCSLPEFISDEN